MEFELVPVDSIPEYINVYCDFNGDQKHLPIIWRYTNRSSYSGWADWHRKYGMINFYYLYWTFISKNRFTEFIDQFLRIYYHEFMHLFFKFRSGMVYFKGKMRRLDQNEKVIDYIAVMLFTEEIIHVGNWADEMFKGEF